MKKTNGVEKTQGFTQYEAIALEKFVFQKLEKQTHDRLREVLTILGIAELQASYSLFPKSCKITTLYETIDFKMFFDNLRNLCTEIIFLSDNQALLKEVKAQKSDLLSEYRTIEDYRWKTSRKTEDLSKIRLCTSEDIKKEIDLSAEITVLKEEIGKAQKKILEAKEVAITNARAKYSRG